MLNHKQLKTFSKCLFNVWPDTSLETLLLKKCKH